MSLGAEQSDGAELDHIRDTLSGLVRFTGNLRSEMLDGFARMDRRFEKVDARLDRQAADIKELKSDVAELKSDVTELKSDNVEIKGMLATILARLPE